ncbi:MAG: signal peptidase I [Bacillus sp. (in: firmicutes)]
MQDHIRQELISWLKTIVLTLVLVFACHTFLFTPQMVSGESMSPTYEDHNRVILSKISEIDRFDTIVFQAPDADAHYIKRVIGLPGDRIEMKDDVLYINGKAYTEPYLESKKAETPFGRFTADFTLEERTGQAEVPEGYLFVMGDNRLNSKDSRVFGCIPEDSVIGEVKFRFYPLNEIGVPK